MVIVSQLYAEKAWQRIWSALDKDGDGVISEAEIARLDRDGDGTLDRHELMSALKQVSYRRLRPLLFSCSLVCSPRACGRVVRLVRAADDRRACSNCGRGGGGGGAAPTERVRSNRARVLQTMSA